MKRKIKTFASGAKVRLKREFLRNTGQYAGPDAHGRWTVIRQDGDFVLVDEPLSAGWFTPEELAADPDLKWRRFHAGNLIEYGRPELP